MGARELLAELANKGLTVDTDGEHLIVRPASMLTEDLRSSLRACKTELVDALRASDDAQAAQQSAPLTAVAMGLGDDARTLLGVLVWLHPQTGALPIRALADATQGPAGWVFRTLDLLQAAGLATRSSAGWSPSRALLHELQRSQTATPGPAGASPLKSPGTERTSP